MINFKKGVLIIMVIQWRYLTSLPPASEAIKKVKEAVGFNKHMARKTMLNG